MSRNPAPTCDTTIPHRVALVTGGSRGIGAAIAQRLANAGLSVHIAYKNSDEQAGQLQADIRAQHGQLTLHKSDIADEQQVKNLVQRIVAAEGAIHILINNAAIIDDRLLALTSLAQWENILRVNLSGPFLLCRAVIPTMLEQGWGRIINISSNSVRIPGPGQTAYAASKGGLEGLTRSLAMEVGRKGIRVNTVAPGKIKTEMTDPLFGQLNSDEPGTRWGLPEDVAGLVAFLASDEADYIQGETITIDGGRLIMRPRGASKVAA